MSTSGKDVQRTRAKARVNIAEQPGIDAQVPAPRFGLPAALGGVVRAGDDVLDVVRPGKPVQGREEGRILDKVLVRDAGPEERDLKVLDRLPVDDFRVEIHAQAIDELLDVANSLVGVPPGIHVEKQRTQAHPDLGQVGDVRAVEPA